MEWSYQTSSFRPVVVRAIPQSTYAIPSPDLNRGATESARDNEPGPSSVPSLFAFGGSVVGMVFFVLEETADEIDGDDFTLSPRAPGSVPPSPRGTGNTQFLQFPMIYTFDVRTHRYFSFSFPPRPRLTDSRSSSRLRASAPAFPASFLLVPFQRSTVSESGFLYVLPLALAFTRAARDGHAPSSRDVGDLFSTLVRERVETGWMDLWVCSVRSLVRKRARSDVDQPGEYPEDQTFVEDEDLPLASWTRCPMELSPVFSDSWTSVISWATIGDLFVILGVRQDEIRIAGFEIPPARQLRSGYVRWVRFGSVALPVRVRDALRRTSVRVEVLNAQFVSSSVPRAKIDMVLVDDTEQELLVLRMLVDLSIDGEGATASRQPSLRWYVGSTGDAANVGFFPRPGKKTVGREVRSRLTSLDRAFVSDLPGRSSSPASAGVVLDEQLRLWKLAWSDSRGEKESDFADVLLRKDEPPGFLVIESIGRIEPQVLVEDTRSLLLSMMEACSEISSSVWTLASGPSRIGSRTSASGTTSVCGADFFAFGMKAVVRKRLVVPLIDDERNRIRFVEFETSQMKQVVQSREMTQISRASFGSSERHVRFDVPEKKKPIVPKKAFDPFEGLEDRPEDLARRVGRWAYSRFAARGIDVERDLLPICRTTEGRQLLIFFLRNLHSRDDVFHVKANVAIRKSEIESATKHRRSSLHDDIDSKRDEVQQTLRGIEELNHRISTEKKILVDRLGSSDLFSSTSQFLRRRNDDGSVNLLLQLLAACESNVPDLVEIGKEIGRWNAWMSARSEIEIEVDEAELQGPQTWAERAGSFLTRKRETSALLKSHLAKKKPVSLVVSLRGEVAALSEDLEKEYFIAESTLPKLSSRKRRRPLSTTSRSNASRGWTRSRRQTHVELFRKIQNNKDKIRSLKREIGLLEQECDTKLRAALTSAEGGRFSRLRDSVRGVRASLSLELREQRLLTGAERAASFLSSEIQEISDVHLAPALNRSRDCQEQVVASGKNLQDARMKARAARSRVEGIVSDIVELKTAITSHHHRADLVGGSLLSCLAKKRSLVMTALRRKVGVHLS